MNPTRLHAPNAGRRARPEPPRPRWARRPLLPGTPRILPVRADREFTKALRAAEMAAWEAALPKAMTADQPDGPFAITGKTIRFCLKCWLQAGLAIGAAAIAMRAALA